MPESETKSPRPLEQLTARLQGLKVWKVVAVKLVRQISHRTSGDIYGREDEGPVVFHDTDTTLDIYLPVNAHKNPAIMNYLSGHLIKHCGITDVIYQALVRSILDYPFSELNKLLEEHNSDDVPNTHRTPVPDSVFEQVSSDSDGAARHTPTAGAGADTRAFQSIFC